MRRSALESKYYKHTTPENNKAYRKQIVQKGKKKILIIKGVYMVEKPPCSI